MTETRKPSPAELYQDYYVPAIFRPLSRFVLEIASPEPGERVLDVGCGTGIVARGAAERVGKNGAVLAVDVNPAMLEIARALPAPEGASIEWQEGDASELAVPEAAFDLVICQQGLQFFPDAPAALRGMRRALADGGRACIAVWQPIDRHPLWEAMAEVEARHLAPLGLGYDDVAQPFSLGEDGLLPRLLADAGFSGSELSDGSVEIGFPIETFVKNTEQAYAAVIPQFSRDPALFEAYVEAVASEVEPLLERFRDGDVIRFEMHSHVALARA